MKDKFNYCIGFYWDNDTKDSIGCYMIHGTEVWYGTMQEAEDTLEYAKSRSSVPERQYQIFRVVPQTEYDELAEKAWKYDDLCE